MFDSQPGEPGWEKRKTTYRDQLNLEEEKEYEAEEEMFQRQKDIENTMYYKTGFSDGKINKFKQSIDVNKIDSAYNFGLYMDGFNDGKIIYDDQKMKHDNERLFNKINEIEPNI